MINFIMLEEYILLNVNEIAYTNVTLDDDAEYILNIVMKDGKCFVLEKEKRDWAWGKILEWTGAEKEED